MARAALGVRDVANLLGVSEASVRRWSDAGLLPARRAGPRKERRFRREDVERFHAETGVERDGHPTEARSASSSVAIAGVAVALGTHLAAFYSTDAGRYQVAVPYLKAGLAAGQSCLLAGSDDIVEGFLARLRAESTDQVDRAQDEGRLTTVNPRHTNLAEWLALMQAALLSALAEGSNALRVVVEMTSVSSAIGRDSLIPLEHAINAAVKRHPATMICQYDARDFSGQELLEMLKAHPDLYHLPFERLLLH
jgi:excisionase family DNA binding protein